MTVTWLECQRSCEHKFQITGKSVRKNVAGGWGEGVGGKARGVGWGREATIIMRAHQDIIDGAVRGQ